MILIYNLIYTRQAVLSFAFNEFALTYKPRHFYRHDPGEESSAHPPCYIPKRVESWIPDEIPEPSPKDSWCKNELDVVENTTEEGLKHYPSTSSLDFPITEKIPQEYW